jgi:hypothetical protein
VLGAGVRAMSILAAGRPLPWSAAVESWQQDEAFRETFIGALASAPFRAFLWETPPVSAAAADRPFEWVLADSPALASARPTPDPFQDRIGGRTGVVSFANLGGDARLVVPCAGADLAHYPHLAAFVRGAPSAQVHELWRAVGREVEEHLERTSAPCWVSTSGLGVYWVHVRIDTRPKYYTHAPYRTVASRPGTSRPRAGPVE